MLFDSTASASRLQPNCPEAESALPQALLEQVKPLLKELDLGMPTWGDLKPIVKTWVWPLFLEALAFGVLLEWGRTTAGYLIGQILILISQVWVCVLNVRQLGRNVKVIQQAGTDLDTRLQNEVGKLLQVASSARAISQIDSLSVRVIKAWFSTECDRWQSFNERVFGKLSIISVMAPFFAAAFAKSQTILIAGAKVPTWTFYIWALTLMVLWMLSAISIVRVTRLQLIEATLDIALPSGSAHEKVKTAAQRA